MKPDSIYAATNTIKAGSLDVTVGDSQSPDGKGASGSEVKKRQKMNNGEVATVQQMMGMKAHSPPSHDPSSHDLASHPTVYPQALNSVRPPPVSAQPVPTHDLSVHWSAFLQDQNHADSESLRLHADLERAIIARLKREMNPTGHVSANLQEPNSAVSETHFLRPEMARAINDRSENKRKIEQIQLRQEQIKLEDNHVRTGPGYQRYLPMSTLPPRDLQANLIDRYSQQYHSMKASSLELPPAARAAFMSRREPEISASGIDSYLTRLEEELFKEAFTWDVTNAHK